MARHRAIVAATAVGLVAVGVVFAFWISVVRSADEQAERLVESSAEQISKRLEDFINSRQFVLQTLAETYSNGRPVEEDEFRRTASILHNRFDGVLAINWVAPDSTIVWANPYDANRDAQGKKLVDHPTAAPYYERARREGTSVMTHPLELFQGGRGVAAYFPSNRDGEHLGMVNGVFRVDTMVESALRGATRENYALRLADGDVVLWQDDDYEALVTDRIAASRNIDVMGRSWTMSIVPRNTLWNVIRGDHPTLLLVGLFCALLLALLTFITLDRQRQRIENLRALQEADRRVQEAQKFDALGRLARGIAHDFNNLLSAISTSADLLALDESLTTDGDANVEAIQVASERAHDLTRQIMLFGDPKAVTAETTTELHAFADRWERFLRQLLSNRVTLEFEPPPAVAVRLDESSLMRVLTNLVINASDAIGDGGTIRVTWTVNGDQVELRVVDDGAGMDEETKRRVFEPYFTTKGEGGTGLGLPTVFGIVQAVGGTIEVESDLGVGTTFAVVLPSVSI